MLTIRLTRKGKKNQPFFRIVVIDKRRSSKGGRAVEELGYVNPLTKKNSVDKERALYWISKGAQPSPRVHNLLVSEKILDAKKINVFKVKKSKAGLPAQAGAPVPAAASAPAGAPAPEANAPVPEAKVEETPKPAETTVVAEEKPAEVPVPTPEPEKTA